MQFGVMVTNGPGGHPSWKHADVSAQKLIVDPLPADDPDGRKTEAASELRHKTRQLLEAHHEKVKKHELDMLGKHGVARHSQPLDPEAAHVSEAVSAVVALTKGTVLEAHYARPDVQKALGDVLAGEFRTQQHIHRNEHKAKGA